MRYMTIILILISVGLIGACSAQKTADQDNCEIMGTCPEDSDGDGIFDFKDNCPNIFNEDQIDIDISFVIPVAGGMIPLRAFQYILPWHGKHRGQYSSSGRAVYAGLIWPALSCTQSSPFFMFRGSFFR